MFAATDNFTHHLCPVPDEWSGVFSLNAASPLASRAAFVPALPHSSRSAASGTHSHSETDRCLRRSYAIVEKLRHAVSL